jgi:hypothetical protein
MKKARKILVALLILTFVLSTVSVGFAAPKFSDINDEDVAKAVGRLSALKILDGYPDGTFKPDNTITRAEFAKIMVTALGVGTAADYAKGTTKFTDVPATHWASGYINVASDMGIIKGRGNGIFDPGAQVTYAEAITMIVRALGYEPKALALGGYPGGYLAIAAEKDITDGINVVNSLAASRGDVAKMVDNSLEVPMMVQKTFGQYPEYEEDETKTLLTTKLGFEKKDGVRVTAIPRTDSKLDDDEIKIDNKVYTLKADVDVEELLGQEVTIFVDGDEIWSIDIDSEFYYDALKDVTDGGLTLVDADEDYDIAEDAIVYINGEKKAVKDLGEAYDYAKVVLNDDGEVAFIDAYKWDDYIVVEKVEDNTVFGYGDELDVEDYTIVKDGKVISLEDLKKGDILFYNNNAEYAEVFNKTVSGEIENVFNNSFEVNDEAFDYQNVGYYGDKYVQYINEDDEIDNFDADVADQMKDEGDVTVFVDRNGNAVFVSGDLGAVEKSTLAGILYENLSGYKDTRGRDYIEIKMVNEKGEDVTYDFRLDDLKAITLDNQEIWNDDDSDVVPALTGLGTPFEGDGINVDDDATAEVTFEGTAEKGDIVEVTLDADGDVVELGFFTSNKATISSADNVKSTDKYIKSKKTSSSVPVFFVEDANWDEKDVEVKTLGDLDEIKINAGVVFHDGSDVLYIVVTDSDLEDTTKYKGVITDVRENTDGYITRIKALVEGKETTYYMDDPESITGSWAEGDPVEIEVYDQTGKVKQLNTVTTASFTVDSNFAVVVKDREITDGSNTWKLVSDGYIYDVSDTSDIESMSFSELRDVEAGTEIVVVLDEAGSKYAKFILVGADTTPIAGDLTFEIGDISTATLTLATENASWGRTVTASVYADLSDTWDNSVNAYEVSVDKALISASGISARSVSGVSYNATTGIVSFTVVFNEDVFVGDTLEIKDNAITITGKTATDGDVVQKATVKKGEIDIQ